MNRENKHVRKVASKAVVNSAVRDYGNEPFFVKRANDSKLFLEKHGLPQAFQKPSGKS
jgi:hypothetical protein